MAESFEKDLFSQEDYDLLSVAAGGYKYSVYSGRFFVLEGHGGVRKYERTEIVFRLKKKLIKVSGENLRIKQMTKNFVVVSGNIISCGVSDD